MHSRCLKISQFHYNITVLIIIISCFLPLHGGSSSVGLENDTIIFNTSSLKDPQTIVSRNQLFKLGFYSPENTTNRYMAVFFAYSETRAVWIANRDRPLEDSSGVITVSKEGNLVLMNGDNEVVWSTNTTRSGNYEESRRQQPITSAQILDSGKLVLYCYDNSSTGKKVIIWDSFSHPSDVWLPTMALTDDTNTGNKVMVSSWTNRSDPTVGSFRLGLQSLNIPQYFIWHSDGRPHHRSGQWNGRIFIGQLAEYQHLNSEGYGVSEISPGIFNLIIPPLTALRCFFFLDAFGKMVPMIWIERNKSWYPTLWTPANECDIYGKCGPFGVCDIRNSPAICSCVRGFEPVDKEEWDRRNWTSGCVRKTQLQCNNHNRGKERQDGFLRLRSLKVPDFAEQLKSTDEEECGIRCLQNCSCTAYTYDLSQLGCMVWRERDEGLIDTQQFPDEVGLDLYVRLAASELDDDKDKRLMMIIVIPLTGFTFSILVLIFISRCLTIKKRVITEDKIEEQSSILFHSTGIFLQDVSERSVRIKELTLFSYNILSTATNHFHDGNLLGEGGFGRVYKGQLKNGKEIAVKRLSKASSSQGADDFTNVVLVISKLQHTNLIRLLGCCVEEDEKMLIYEFMPNKSLDVCLFDLSHPSRKILDWKKRLNIIKGIGRGLLYLHKDSRLRIIHRDLKASNVLLDQEWEPKISDFGMARIFDTNQDQANTVRVAGTYGYMAPEYATDGIFSEKSDVYSFGVLMLEIISGKKTTSYYNTELSLSLLGCAWRLLVEDNGVAFLDEEILTSNSSIEEMIRCIHIALLCVQEFAKYRPTVQTVLSMLEGEIVSLPIPEQPLFADRWNSSADQSTNQMSVTELHER